MQRGQPAADRVWFAWVLILFMWIDLGINVEFLDEECLGMNGSTNVPQKNPFIMLASKWMIAVGWLFSIIHVSIVIPSWWPSGSTHKQSEYNWGARSMRWLLDMLPTTCSQLLNLVLPTSYLSI
jgi:hypothetical protein